MPVRVIPPRSPKAPHFVWHYIQPGVEKPIATNEGEADLIEKVLNFRLDNVLERASEEEVTDDVKAYHRSIDGRSRRQKVRPAHVRRGLPRGMSNEAQMVAESTRTKLPESRTLIDHLRLWLKLAKKRRWDSEPQAIVTDRADTCAACPRNRALADVSICKPCIPHAERDITILANRKGDPRLGVCEAVFHSNQVAVMMPLDELKARSLTFVDQTPEGCWLRTMSDIKRVDQGAIVANAGEVNVELTPAAYPTPPVKVENPEKDTRVDLITGEEIQDRIIPE